MILSFSTTAEISLAARYVVAPLRRNGEYSCDHRRKSGSQSTLDRPAGCSRDEGFAIQEIDDARRVSRIDTGALGELAEADRRTQIAKRPTEPASLGSPERFPSRWAGAGFSFTLRL
jgi:hypothetical protein